MPAGQRRVGEKRSQGIARGLSRESSEVLNQTFDQAGSVPCGGIETVTQYIYGLDVPAYKSNEVFQLRGLHRVGQEVLWGTA